MNESMKKTDPEAESTAGFAIDFPRVARLETIVSDFEKQLLADYIHQPPPVRFQAVIRRLAESYVQGNRYWSAICSLGETAFVDPSYRYIFEMYAKFSRQVLQCLTVLKSMVPAEKAPL